MVVGNAKCVWRIPSGIRVAQGDFNETLSIDLKAWPHVDEGELVSVTFHVSVNGGAATDHVVNGESVRVPNFSSQNSPLPGVVSGMAWMWCSGFDLDLTTLAGGTVVVTATVRSHLGGTDYDTTAVIGCATGVAESLTIYNDTDGGDRRPANTTVWVSPTGSDANSGLTSLLPKLTLTSAISALVAAETADIGGGTIILMTGQHDVGGSFGASSWHTSGRWWLNIVFETGASVTRVLDGAATLFPESYLIATGNGAGTVCRVRLVGGRVLSSGYVMHLGTDVTGCMWFDGGSSASMHDTGSNLVAKFYDDTGEMVGFDGNAAGGRWMATCHEAAGRLDGCVGATYLHDIVVDRWLGLAIYDTGEAAAMHCVNLYIANQDYIYEDAESAVDGVIDYAGGNNIVVSSQVGGAHAGKMRLTFAGGTPYDIGAHALAGLVGSVKLGLVLTGFTSGANNGAFPVLDAGTGFLILDNASEVAGAAGASARMVTGRVSDGEVWNNLVHPDIWRIQGDRNSTLERCAVAHSVLNTQAMFTAGYDMTFGVFDDITMPPNCRNNFDGSVFTDCIFRHITVAAAFDMGGGASAPNSVFHDIVCDSASTTPASAKSITRFHRVTGGAIGTNGTTGAWFNGAGSYLPAVGVRGLDSGLYTRHASAKWLSDVAWSQGCSSYIGEADWTEPDGGGGGGNPGPSALGAGGGLALGLSLSL